MSKKFILIFSIYLFAGVFYNAFAQASVSSSSFVTDPEPAKNQLTINFDKDLVVVGGLAQFQGLALIVTDDNGAETAVTVDRSDVEVQGGGVINVLIITFQSNPALADAKKFEIKISKLRFIDGDFDINTTGDVLNTMQNLELKRKAQKAAFDAAKPTDAKPIFAGFNFAASDKDKSEGNAELITNIPLQSVMPNLYFTLNLKKSSKEDADPKQFDFGFAYRKPFTFNLSCKKAPGTNKCAAVNSSQDVIEKLKNLQSNQVLLGLFHEVTGRIEGEPINFNTTNAVFEVMPFQIVSRVKNLGSRDLFMKFHIIPAGFELGRNLRTENEITNKYYISRFKIGGEFALFYQPQNQDAKFIKRAELNLRAVNRYLFRDETAFDQITEKATGISKGNKTYFQLDAKVFFTDMTSGRFGFKVSRIRGTLPPTFNDTRAYTFGIIFESAEDKDK